MLRILAISSSLARLRSIHYGGWIVFGDPPGATPPGWRGRPSMLFLSNYDGEPAEYLAAFGIVVSPGMRWTFGSAEDFPGARPTRRFIDYVEQRRIVELMLYSAYPDRTVRDVDTALAVSEQIERLRRLGDDASDIRFGAAYRSLVDALVLAPEPPVPGFWSGAWQALRHRSTVSGVVVAVPVEPGRRHELEAAVRDLAAADEPSFFEQAGGVHFARVAVLGVAGRRDRSVAPTSRLGATSPRHDGDGEAEAEAEGELLLLAAWVDGDARQFIRRLAGTVGDRADALWGSCPGYPGAADAAVLAEWIAAHQLPISLFVGCRSGVSVAAVRTAIERWERAVDLVDAVQGRPLAEVRRDLKGLWT
ncbi:MAG: hypothetical protein ACRD2C_22520 [Acidimicrobiales bacterium]